MDKEYNRMYVSGNGVSENLDPGESVLFPPRTFGFSVSRAYRDHTRSYSVSCPPIDGTGIRIKMIDIHVNRIAGGCKTVSAGKN